MKIKYVCLGGLMVIILIVVAGWLLYRGDQGGITHSTEQWKVIVDLSAPDNDGGPGACGFVSITLSENTQANPVDKLNQILGEFGQGGQYAASSVGENLLKDDEITYRQILGALSSNFLGHNIPLIRQDNAGENFCFYTFAKNIVSGGGSSWWDYNGVGTLTVILPENYELRSDVLDSVGRKGKTTYKDNEFSVFTGAPELTREFENHRWMIKADFTPLIDNEHAKWNTDLYLEIHYRKVSLP